MLQSERVAIKNQKLWIETTNEKSSGEKRVIREKMSLASFPWKGNSNKPLSSKKIAGVRTRGKESRSVAA